MYLFADIFITSKIYCLQGIEKEETDRCSYKSLFEFYNRLFNYINGFYIFIRSSHLNNGLSHNQKDAFLYLSDFFTIRFTGISQLLRYAIGLHE